MFFTKPTFISYTFRYFARYWVIVSALLVVSTFTIYSRNHLNEYIYTSLEEVVHIAGSTKLEEHEIPVYIVDQHAEVLPHWYSAVDKDLLKRQDNTLIHMSPHLKMTPPINNRYINKFNSSKDGPFKPFLPLLMQAKDDDIQSVIYHGFINHVVWVKPSWYMNHSRIESKHRYIGVLKNDPNGKLCSCEFNDKKKDKKNDPICYYTVIENETKKHKVIDKMFCQKKKTFQVNYVSENNVLGLLAFQNNSSIIIDINEDYFGVESGVQKLIELGVGESNLVTINSIFAELFYINNNEKENMLDKKMKDFFKSISIINEKLNRKKAIVQKMDILKRYFRQNNEQKISYVKNSFAEFLSSLSTKQAKILSQVRYCLNGTPQVFIQTKPTFTVCHGNLYPSNDKINKYFTPNLQQIQRRAAKLTKMLIHVSRHSLPRIFTISRSLRDGFTPRSLQVIIEKAILKSIKTALKIHKKEARVFYDDYLLYGKNGWDQNNIYKGGEMFNGAET